MKQFKLYIRLILVLLLVSSCKEDTELGYTADSRPNVTLLIRIPGHKPPSTYRMAVTDENSVNEVTVLGYKNNAGAETLVEKIVIPANQITNFSGDVKVEAVIPTNNYNRLVIIANANAQLASLNIGSTLNELMNVEYTNSTGRWDVSSPAKIPMSAQITAQATNDITIKEGISKVFNEVNLTRMMARIDIQNTASTDFTLKNVYLYNLNRNGLIVAGSAYLSSPAQPTLPTAMLKIKPNPMVYDYASLHVANQLIRQIYTFEAEAPVGASIASSPRIILEGTYNGVDCFYPVDFTYDGSYGTSKGSYMPIVRNHKYMFTISQVKGVGYTSAAAALVSATNYTNIIVKLLAIDDQFFDVYYDRENLLAITKNEYILEGSEYSLMTETNLLGVLTDVTVGWTATYTQSDGFTPATWLKLIPASGPGGTKTNAVINVTQAPTARTGYIIIKAGGLQAKIRVRQQ